MSISHRTGTEWWYIYHLTPFHTPEDRRKCVPSHHHHHYTAIRDGVHFNIAMAAAASTIYEAIPVCIES